MKFLKRDIDKDLVMITTDKIIHHPHFEAKLGSQYKMGMQTMAVQLRDKKCREFIFATYEHILLQKALEDNLKGVRPKIITVSETYPDRESIKEHVEAVKGRYAIEPAMPPWNLSMRFALDVLPVLCKLGAGHLVLEALYKDTKLEDLADFYESKHLFGGGKISPIEKALLSTGDPTGVCLTLFASSREKLALSGVFEEGSSPQETFLKIAQNMFNSAKTYFDPPSILVIYGGKQYFHPKKESVLDNLKTLTDEESILSINLRWREKQKDFLDKEVLKLGRNQIDLELSKRSYHFAPPVKVEILSR